jgi:hypothetical protein
MRTQNLLMMTAKEENIPASTMKRKDDIRVDLKEEEAFPQFTREDFLSLVKNAITSPARKPAPKAK